MPTPNEEFPAERAPSGLTPQQEATHPIFKRFSQFLRAQGQIDDRTDTFHLPEELPLLYKCQSLWKRLFPDLDWNLTDVAIWLDIECGVSCTDTRQIPMEQLFELLKCHLKTGTLNRAAVSKDKEEIEDVESALLKESDSLALTYRDGDQWCDTQYALTIGVSAQQIDRARQNGVYGVRLTDRRKADAIGRPYVYRRSELQELSEAIPDEKKAQRE